MAIPPINPQNRTTSAIQTTPAAPVQTPSGVAEAPTTLNSASQPQPQPEGYIVPFLNWVCGWISWIFRKIFCCGSQAVSPMVQNQPAQDSPAPSAAPSDVSRASSDRRQSIAAPQATLTNVREELNLELELLRRFQSRDNTEQALILQRIGQQSYRNSRLNTWGYFLSFETIGRRAVDRNPRLLEGYV